MKAKQMPLARPYASAGHPTGPRAAVLLAVSVSVVFPVIPVTGLGAKDAVTPLGKPDAESVTLPVNPFWGIT